MKKHSDTSKVLHSKPYAKNYLQQVACKVSKVQVAGTHDAKWLHLVCHIVHVNLNNLLGSSVYNDEYFINCLFYTILILKFTQAIR